MIRKVLGKSTELGWLRTATPPPESRAVYEVMWKNMVEPDRPQMTLQYGACALHAG